MKNNILSRFFGIIAASFIYSSILCPVSNAQTITTVAGQGGAGYNGDGIAATTAQLYMPACVIKDNSGNIYIGDIGNHRIRKISSSGVITTIAGTGSSIDTGNGVPATAAGFSELNSLVRDASGNIYVGGEKSIRKISTSGIVTTVIGRFTGSYAFSGDGGQATAARTGRVGGIAIDASGNIYFSDNSNSRIRKISTSGIVSTIAGTGTAGFSGDGGAATAARLNMPARIAINTSGEIVFNDFGNFCVRKISVSGVITTIAGASAYIGTSGDGGPATDARFSVLSGLAIDAGNNIYVTDGHDNRIRKINTSGIINTVVVAGATGFNGDGIAATAATFSVADIFVDGSGYYFCDQISARVRKINTSGIISTIAGMGHPGFMGDGGAAVNAELSSPNGAVLDGSGNLYIADLSNNRIRKVTPSGTITTIAGNGVRSYTGNGGPATAAQLYQPSSVAVDGSGNIFIMEVQLGATVTYTIRKINPSGIISLYAGGGSSLRNGIPATAAKINCNNISVDQAGNLYYPDYTNHIVRKINTSGIISTFAGNGTADFSGDGGAATAAALNYPWAVSFDGFGNVYIADFGNHRIRRVTPAGIISTVAGSGSYIISGDGGAATAAGLGFPSLIAVDSVGDIFIPGNANTIRQISTSGIIRTICGTGVAGYAGDGGAASAARLFSPASLFVTPSGTLYFSDAANNTIRKINMCNNPTVSAIAGSTSVIAGYSTTLTDATAGGTWSSSNTAIATISATGAVTGVAIGSATISYIKTNSCGSAVTTKNITVVNNAPGFLSSRYSVGFCSTMGSYPLNSLLRVNDADGGQTLTWSLVSGPRHGTAAVAYTATSTGSIVTPSGLTYTPAGGFYGTDTFTVTATDGFASSNIAIYITVMAGPAMATISGPTSVCEGATITLTSSVSGGTWSTETSLATVSSAGVVTGRVGNNSNTVYYTTTSSCGSYSAPYPIRINKVPDPYPIVGAATVAVGNTITLTDITAGGAWSSSTPSVASVYGGTVTGISAGSSTISYTVTNECGTTVRSKTVTVTSRRGINETAEGNGSIRIYPNPSHGFFTLELPDGTDEATILILDISGKTMAKVIAKSQKEDFDVSSWAKGMYIINVTSNTTTTTNRIVVE